VRRTRRGRRTERGTGMTSDVAGGQGYELLEEIGRGAYSVVYRALDARTGAHVAMKRIINAVDDEGIEVTAMREVGILRVLRHEGIISVLDVVLRPTHFDIVLELMSYHLRNVIDSAPGCLDVSAVVSFTRQILNALEYMHEECFVVHRDLKPQNILLDERGRIKLADFGLARSEQAMGWFAPCDPASPAPSSEKADADPKRLEYTARVTTLWYRPPEMLLGSSDYGASCDMWGLGTILLEMVSGQVLFPGRTEVEQMFRIFRALGTPTAHTFDQSSLASMPDWHADLPRWPGVTPEALLQSYRLTSWTEAQYTLVGDLLNSLLRCNPDTRTSARAALSHQFFTESFVQRGATPGVCSWSTAGATRGDTPSPKLAVSGRAGHSGTPERMVAESTELDADGVERMATTPKTTPSFAQRRGQAHSVTHSDTETFTASMETSK